MGGPKRGRPAILVAATLLLVLASCGGRLRRDPPTTDAGGDVDTDVDVDADADSDSDTETDDSRCLDRSEMPPQGPFGEPCETDGDCEKGLFCALGDERIGFLGGVCVSGGAIDEGGCVSEGPEACPPGATCAEFLDEPWGFCIDACVTSERNTPMETSCGCRDGHLCSFGHCMPGCDPAGDDCCWQYTQDPPVDGRGPEDCRQRCLAESSRCYNPGSVGARFGGPCLVDEDCPALGFCHRFWTETVSEGLLHTTYTAAGLCTSFCDTPSWPDPCEGLADTVCVHDLLGLSYRGGDAGSRIGGSWCLEACDPLAGDRGGCSRDDFVCYPAGEGPDETGYCLPSCAEYDGDRFCMYQNLPGTCQASGHCR